MRAFLAGEALAAGHVTRYELAANHRRVLPGVYAPNRAPVSLADRIHAAWLWSGRRGVVSGLAAAAMHGAKWIEADVQIELNLAHNKAPAGITVRRDTLLAGEVVRLSGVPVTSVERTAFDLARRGREGKAVERLDSLARATRFAPDDVLSIVDAHPRVRGRRRVAEMLERVDAGAQSPKETWLRLLLIDAGFPTPTTQIPILRLDGYPRYFLDLGWEEFMVAAEYDGEQHRTDLTQYRSDVTRAEYIDGLGWRRIRVLAGHQADDIVRRVESAGVPRRR